MFHCVDSSFICTCYLLFRPPVCVCQLWTRGLCIFCLQLLYVSLLLCLPLFYFFLTLFLSTLSLFFLSYYLFRCIYLSFSISLLYIVRHLNKTISHKFCCTCISYRPPPLSLFALVISNTVTIATYIYRIDCHTYVVVYTSFSWLEGER